MANTRLIQLDGLDIHIQRQARSRRIRIILGAGGSLTARVPSHLSAEQLRAALVDHLDTIKQAMAQRLAERPSEALPPSLQGYRLERKAQARLRVKVADAQVTVFANLT